MSAPLHMVGFPLGDDARSAMEHVPEADLVCRDVIVEGVMCGGPPSLAPPPCVVCGGVEPRERVDGVMWSCGGCCAFFPFLPPECPASMVIRGDLIRNTPKYCGVDCQDEHWFGGHRNECRRDDVSMYSYVHVSSPSLHDSPILPLGRRVVHDGMIFHIPSLVSSPSHDVPCSDDVGDGGMM